MTLKSVYFYGNKVSEYGIKNGYVDYATLAKAFDAVLNNNIMEQTADLGYWEQVSGMIDNSEEQDEETSEKIRELEEQIEELEREQDEPGEVYQWYIVSDPGSRILEEAGEIVYYNETLDMYLWGVTHWGTSWDYVLTNIAIDCEEVE